MQTVWAKLAKWRPHILFRVELLEAALEAVLPTTAAAVAAVRPENMTNKSRHDEAAFEDDPLVLRACGC